MKLTRRGLLVGAAAGGGLLVAWSLMGPKAGGPLRARDGELAAGAWLRIGPDGIVTVALPVLEMGQGIATVLAQIAATELGADWSRIAVEPAPVDPAYGDAVLAAHWAPLWLPGGVAAFGNTPDRFLARRYAARTPLMATADGTALPAFEAPLRAAAATARELLIAAAADEWDVSAVKCRTDHGAVIAGKRRLPFGKLADAASRLSPPDDPPLRPEPARERPPAAGGDPHPPLPKLAAPAFPRLDLPAKVTGAFRFAGDVRLPGMVFAAIAQGPQGDTVLGRYDAAKAGAVPGFVALVPEKRWLAAVASHWFAADRAIKAAAPTFRGAKGGVADSGPIESAIDAGLARGSATRIAETADPDPLVGPPGKPPRAVVCARYDVEPALPAALETPTAVARFSGDRLELWLATQAPAAARKAAAKAAGLPVEAVTLTLCHAGGSFEAKLDTRIAAQVATIAKAVRRPVQLMWSRWQDSLATFPRPPLSVELAAAFAKDGQNPAAWRTRVAMPATAREFGRRLLHGEEPVAALRSAAGEADPLGCAGFVPPYGVSAMAVDHVPVALALPTGPLRANSHGIGCFVTESFVDEMAHAAKREPLSFRMGLLGGQPRLAACLQGVASLATWGGGGDGSGQGIACHRIDLVDRSGFIAVVATAQRGGTGVKVERLSAYVDIGRIVNLDIARQQIEGGLVFGMGLTIGGSTAWARGLPLSGHLRELGLPLLADCPAIDVAFAQSDEPPFDPGELGVAAVGPAIANALFSATGLRFRRLPLLSEGL